MAARNRTKREQFTNSLLVPSWLTSQSSAWEHDHAPLSTHLRLLHSSPGLAELGLAPTRRSKAPFHRDFVKDVGTRCQGFVHHLCGGFENTKVRHSAVLQQQHSGRLLAPSCTLARLLCTVTAGGVASACCCRCCRACGLGACCCCCCSNGGCCSLSLCHSTRMKRLLSTASVLEMAFLASSLLRYWMRAASGSFWKAT